MTMEIPAVFLFFQVKISNEFSFNSSSNFHIGYNIIHVGGRQPDLNDPSKNSGILQASLNVVGYYSLGEYISYATNL